MLALAAQPPGLAFLGVGLIWAALFEPWPISRRQGPDTGYAQDLYRKLLGEDAPGAVRDLYARDEWGFGGNPATPFVSASRIQQSWSRSLRNRGGSASSLRLSVA